MQLLGLLLPVIGLIGFAAFIWLLVVAFRHSALWGVLVLFLSPITAIIFAVKNWDEAKKPFLFYIGSSAASVAIMMMTVMFVGAEMVQAAREMDDQMKEQFGEMAATPPDLEPANDATTAGGRPATTASEAAGVSADAMAAVIAARAADTSLPQATTKGLDTEAATASRVSAIREPVSIRNIERYAGEPLRITTNDGAEFVGHFLSRSGDEYEFEKRLRAGTFVVYVERDEIRSVETVGRR